MLLSILILCHICKSENELQEDLNPQTIASSKKLKSYYCAITQVTGLPSSIITWQYDYLLANIKELQILNTPWANKTAANFLALFEQRDNGIKVCFIIFYTTLLIFILYWSIVDLQCVLVSGVQQSDSVIHIHISTLFQILFHLDYNRILSRVPCAIQ